MTRIPHISEPLFDAGTQKVNDNWHRFLDDLSTQLSTVVGQLPSGGGGTLAQGKHTIWMPAAAMIPQTTNGPALVTTELPTFDVMLRTLDFDQATVELAQFQVGMPKSWDGGTLTFIPYWTAASGSGTVSWRLNMRAQNDDDALDQDQGASQPSNDTLIATNDLHIGPESAAITPAGTPGDHSLLFCKIRRDTTNDTLTADAKLIGLKVFYSINASNDA